MCTTESRSPVTSRSHTAYIYSAVTAVKKRWQSLQRALITLLLYHLFKFKSGLVKTVAMITKTIYFCHCLTLTVVNMIEYTNNLFSFVLLRIMLPKIYQTVENQYQLSLLMTVVTPVNP